MLLGSGACKACHTVSFRKLHMDSGQEGLDERIWDLLREIGTHTHSRVARLLNN
jgi:hypothetical protein